ncbi:MAG: class I SAM-dependent methyltransferase [Pseudomonadota bacterium]
MTPSIVSGTSASSEMLAAEYFRMADVEAEMWWYTSLHLHLVETIRKFFGENKQIRILDAGCGTGGFLRYLQRQGYANSIGLDISDIAVEFSRRQGFDVNKGSIADAAVLKRIGKVDVIVSMDVICSLPSEEQRVVFFREAERLLNDDGLMIIQTPAFASLGGIHDMAVGVNKRYTKSEIRDVLRQADIAHYNLGYRLMVLTPVIFMVRAMQRMRLKLGKDVAIESDVKMPSRIVNTLLFLLQRMEDRWLLFRPFGTSLQILISKGDVDNEVRTK